MPESSVLVLVIRSIAMNLKFLNALSTEYDVQKQMLEDKESGFSREVVMTTVIKLFESGAFKKLLPSSRNKKPLHGDQAFVADDAQG